MNVIQQLTQDAKITERLAEQVIGILRGNITESTTANELAFAIHTAPNARLEAVILQGLMVLAEEAGKHRGGTPTLADEILDRQFANVKRYGEKAYRLSNKQVGVIVRDAWGFVRPEMLQGA